MPGCTPWVPILSTKQEHREPFDRSNKNIPQRDTRLEMLRGAGFACLALCLGLLAQGSGALEVGVQKKGAISSSKMADVDYSVHSASTAPLVEWDQFKWLIPQGTFVAYSTSRRKLTRFMGEVEQSRATGVDHVSKGSKGVGVGIVRPENADNGGSYFTWGDDAKYYAAGYKAF